MFDPNRPGKTCPRCDTYKPRAEFGRNITAPDGMQGYCRICMRAAVKANRDANRRRATGTGGAATRVCANPRCDRELDSSWRSHARHCSDACRYAAHWARAQTEVRRAA